MSLYYPYCRRAPSMSITVSLHHKTTYSYERAVKLAPHVVRLRPAPHCRTPILAYSLKVRPEQHFLNWQQDPVRQLPGAPGVPARDRATLERRGRPGRRADAINPFDFFVDERAQEYPFKYTDELSASRWRPTCELLPSRRRVDALAAELKREVARAGRRTIDVLVDINRHIQRSAALRDPHGGRACSRPRTRWSAATGRAATSPG